MFKPGEVARIRFDGRGSRPPTVTILDSSVIGAYHKWPVATSDGVFDETELSPAHPTVLATATGPDFSSESFRASVTRMAAEEPSGGLSWELLSKVQKALLKATLDFNGHWKNGALLREDFKAPKHLLLLPDSMTETDAEDSVRVADAGGPLNRWVPLDASLGLLTGLRTCSCCGDDDFTVETNGLVMRLAGEPCKFPNGLPPTEWELNVPSGKLVVANDLRGAFPATGGRGFRHQHDRGMPSDRPGLRSERDGPRLRRELVPRRLQVRGCNLQDRQQAARRELGREERASG